MARYRLCLLWIACLASTWFAVACSKDKTPTSPTTTCSFSVSEPSVTTVPSGRRNRHCVGDRGLDLLVDSDQ